MDKIPIRNFGFKNISLTLVGILVLLVAYKYISAGIDARNSLQAREPLNQCINNINSRATYDIKQMRDLARDLNSEPSHSLCMTSSHGTTLDTLIASGKINLNDYCVSTYQEQDVEEQKILDTAEIDRAECYKQYK